MCVVCMLFTLLSIFSFPVITKAEDGLGVSYSAFFSQNGWGIWYMDNSNVVSEGNYISALRLGLYNQPQELNGTIRYQVNVSGLGWLDEVENGAETGKADFIQEPLESVRVKLSGNLEEAYDIYTKVLQNNETWTNWVKNGEDAGTAGVGTHITGIRITIRAKGSEAPNENDEKTDEKKKEQKNLAKRSIDPNKPMIALTFDDGPSEHTGIILDVLEKYNARATFFVIGNNLKEKNIPVVQRAISLGNEIGNHTVSHPDLTQKSTSVVSSQIDGVEKALREITGTKPNLLRPPYGSYNRQVLNQLSKKGYACILWSVDTLDWKTKSADSTTKTVLEKAKDGDIVLMHDSQKSSALAMERIVKGLQDKGYQLVTVSELAKQRGQLNAGKAYSSFRR